MGKVRGFKDYKFKGIYCMISLDKDELGFFKNKNDVRPSQATYIKKEQAEHLYNLFTNKVKEETQKDLLEKLLLELMNLRDTTNPKHPKRDEYVTMLEFLNCRYNSFLDSNK